MCHFWTSNTFALYEVKLLFFSKTISLCSSDKWKSYTYIWNGTRVERMEFPFNSFPCILMVVVPLCCILIVVVALDICVWPVLLHFVSFSPFNQTSEYLSGKKYLKNIFNTWVQFKVVLFTFTQVCFWPDTCTFNLSKIFTEYLYFHLSKMIEYFLHLCISATLRKNFRFIYLNRLNTI